MPSCVTLKSIQGDGSEQKWTSDSLSDDENKVFSAIKEKAHISSRRFRSTWTLQGTNLNKVLRMELRKKDKTTEKYPLFIASGEKSMLKVLLPQKLTAGLFLIYAYIGLGTPIVLGEVFVLRGETIRCKTDKDCSPGTCNTTSGLCIGPRGNSGTNGKDGINGKNGTSCTILSSSITASGNSRVLFQCDKNTHPLEIKRGPVGPAGTAGKNGENCTIQSQKTTAQKDTEILFQCGSQTQKVLIYRGIKGDKGDKGDKGNGLKIDHVGRFSELQKQSSPVIGETFLVQDTGHSKHNHLFVYNGSNFVDAGRLAGVPGPTGSACKVTGSRTNASGEKEVTFQCGANQQTITLPKGPKGDKGDRGDKGQTGPPGNTGSSCFLQSSTLSTNGDTKIVFQCGLQKKEVLVAKGLKGEKGDKGDVLEPATKSYLTQLQTFLKIDSTKSRVTFTKVNVHINNGQGRTDSVNALGNLQIGYNAKRPKEVMKHSGSHNLILGDQNEYIAFGGLVAGFNNTISGIYATITAGRYNTASGEGSTISGGDFNIASGFHSSVSGGMRNTTLGNSSHVCGGQDNLTKNSYAVVVGGEDNIAVAKNSVVLGGFSNGAIGAHSICIGGHNVSVKTAFGTKP